MVTKKLSLLSIIAFVMLATSCNEESHDESFLKEEMPSKQISDNVVITDDGELIHIEDTTVYTVSLSDFSPSKINGNDIWITSPHKVSSQTYPKKKTIIGFDSKKQFWAAA